MQEAGGFYPISEKDLFDCEYWSLEQAKLGKGKAPVFQGKVVLVTGGSGNKLGLKRQMTFACLRRTMFFDRRKPRKFRCVRI